MRISLDLDSTTPAVVGARAGVPPHRLNALTGALVDLLARFDEAEASGLLPHLAMCRQPGGMARWVAHGAGWAPPGRRSSDRLVLVGEPGAAAAARLLVPLGAAARLRVVDRPDPGQVEEAFAGCKRPRLVVLLGPAWVQALAALLRPQAAAVTVFDGEEGGHEHPAGSFGSEPDIEWIDAAGSADPRFGFCLPAALCVAGFCGASGDELAVVASDALAECTDPAVRRNPAARLGALAAHLAVIEGLATPLILSPSSAMDGWARWAAGAWAAISSRHVPVVGGESPRGAAPVLGRLGDEAVVQRALVGPRDLWVFSPELRSGSAGDPMGRLQGQMASVARSQFVDDGRPVARLHVDGEGPAARLALALVWVQAAIFAAALDPVDPLSMDAADRWRERLDGARD